MTTSPPRTALRLALALGVAAAAASGCWARHQGASYVMPGYDEQNLVRVAVLPVVNQSEWAVASDAVQTALAAVLTREKKYDVAPRSLVTGALGRGGGGATWVRMIEALNQGGEPSDQPLGRIAKDLEADGLLAATVVAFHQTVEEKPATSPQGQIYYRHYPVTVIQLKAFLWGARAGAVVWRDEHTERYYHEPGAEGRGQPARIAEIAARELLSRLPENAWRPVAPAAPTPVPSPVLSFHPFPAPADPSAPQTR